MNTIYKKFVSWCNRSLFDSGEVLPPRLSSKIIAVVCLVNLLLIGSDIYELYGAHGLVGAKMPDPLVRRYVPSFSLLGRFFDLLHVNEGIGFYIIIGVYVTALIFVLLDYKRLVFAFVAFSLQLMTVTSSFLFSHGGDSVTTFLLFINILICLDEVIKRELLYRTIYSFAIRLLQVQLCIIYFFFRLW
ncbi:hypothetical protein [Chitinophaga sp. MD30]|uniref:hypothetical protein n=1 Tax=Chitinophaga sp. MD30 TaxID=2033437 RepID=UPI0012FDD3A0|nr:hypothetical protein [Chitinophaga sp. MD30]